MKLNNASMSNANVGKAFNAIVKGIGRNDIGEILFNWNESQLNLDGDRIIAYPGRDGRFSRGKEGGKINISKREFLDWLVGDRPFDEIVYGVNIRNDAQWTGLIQQAREAAFNNSKPHIQMTCAPALTDSVEVQDESNVINFEVK